MDLPRSQNLNTSASPSNKGKSSSKGSRKGKGGGPPGGGDFPDENAGEDRLPKGKGKGKKGLGKGKGKHKGHPPAGDPGADLHPYSSINFADDFRWSFLDQVNMIEEICLPCPTFRKIPQRHVRKFATISSSIASATLSAANPVAYERAWKLFFLLPRFLLQAPTRDRGGRRVSDATLAARAELVEKRMKAE